MSLKGFKAIKIEMPPLRKLKTENPLAQHIDKAPTAAKPITHHIYIKQDKNLDKTVFVVNLPTDTTPKHLDILFKECGKITLVNIQGNESGGYCHVSFEDQVSVELVLGLKNLHWPTLPLLMDELMTGLHRPNIEVVQNLADEAMEIFDQEQQEKRLAEQQRQNVPDEDGFILVGKSTAKRNVGGGASVQTVKLEEAQSLKPKDKSLKDFYRFQMREQKMNGNEY